jgi:hypothetical protein
LFRTSFGSHLDADGSFGDAHFGHFSKACHLFVVGGAHLKVFAVVEDFFLIVAFFGVVFVVVADVSPDLFELKFFTTLKEYVAVVLLLLNTDNKQASYEIGRSWLRIRDVMVVCCANIDRQFVLFWICVTFARKPGRRKRRE